MLDGEIFPSRSRILTLILRISIIPNVIPRIPTLIPLIPIIPTLISIIPTLIPLISTQIPIIPIIPLFPFPDSPFRLLQIAVLRSLFVYTNL